MRVHEEPITHINLARPVTFCAVQLSAPIKDVDWEFDTDKHRWQWRVNSKNRRIREVKSALDLLLDVDQLKRPDVIVFPEYSVPKETHTAIDFQHLAHSHSVIIIPGSYFEDDDRDPETFRRNICKIYLPGPKSITIGKIHAADGEDGLLPATGLPNIARLVWDVPGLKPVSISVFLCRDYITPFDERVIDDGPVKHRVSLLDWEREGINIVVMNNLRSAVFEGRAALDVRDSHGQRKAILFSNCANRDSELGTAVLVASPTRERADIAASVPPQLAGVLMAVIRPWDVFNTEKTPDIKRDSPVKHLASFTISFSEKASLSPLTVIRPDASRRGVWHPAFLEAFRKMIIIDFFSAKTTLASVADIFLEGQIRHVKAALVRGVQDVMIRRYVPKYLVERGIMTPLSPLFAQMSETDQKKLFAAETSDPDLQVYIHPAKILKYRGFKIPQGHELSLAREELSQLSARSDRNEIISRTCALATDSGDYSLDDLQSQPELAAIFQLGFEAHNPIGPAYGNDREAYVLIRAQRPGGDLRASNRFEKEVISEVLMSNPSVREIFEVETKPDLFHYMIQLKCSSYEADDIIWNMHVWAKENAVPFGTRTYDLWRHLTRDSIDGINYTTMDQFEAEFLGELNKLIGSIRTLKLPNEQRTTIATMWRDSRQRLSRIREASDMISRFYLYLTIYNFGGNDPNYRKECGSAWVELCVLLEEMIIALLAKSLALEPLRRGGAVTNVQIQKALLERIPETVKREPNWETFTKYPLRVATYFYSDLTGGSGRLAQYKKSLDNVLEFRNQAGPHPDDGRFVTQIDLQKANWLAQLSKIGTLSAGLCASILEVEQEMMRLGVRIR